MEPSLIERVTQIAAEEREALPKLDIEQLRRAFLKHAARRSRRRVLFWLAPAALLLGIFVYLPLPGDSAELAFEVEGEHGQVGELLAAPKTRALLLHFSDASVVSLSKASEARVLALDANGAKLELERGHAEVSVVHASETHWQIESGPFRTEVVGTRFAVEWDPGRGRFALELFEGSVRVHGPGLQRDCVVSQGNSLRASLAAGTFEGACNLGGRRLEAQSSPASKAPSAAAPSAGPPSAGPPSATVVDAPVEPPGDRWQALAAAGRHRAAWDEVLSHGLENVRARASARDLLMLADLARFTGHADTAVSLLVGLRSRFPASSEARQAAFLLGRVAADQQRAPGTAASWFSTYLSESPGGAFAPEALGRLFDSQRRAGDELAARQSARAYLDRYPAGAYAALARRVLGAPHAGGPAASASQEAP